MDELRNMTDDELNDHRRAVLKEVERRDRLEVIPNQIGQLRDEYTAAGGDLDDLNTGA